MLILLVDDDLYVRFCVWRVLRAAGFSVLSAGDGTSALEVSRNHPGTIDLLLSDVIMPQMGGLELGRTLLVERPGIKVLLMSAGLQVIDHGSIDQLPFVQKPFTTGELRDAIEALLGPTPKCSELDYPPVDA
jgi:two-component system cell cycle sensor histidine kinase/response regulator CckA